MWHLLHLLFFSSFRVTRAEHHIASAYICAKPSQTIQNQIWHICTTLTHPIDYFKIAWQCAHVRGFVYTFIYWIQQHVNTESLFLGLLTTKYSIFV